MNWKFWKRDKQLEEIMHAVLTTEPRVCESYTRLKKVKKGASE